MSRDLCQRADASWAEIQGDILVVHGRSVHRLSGLAAVLWQITDEPVCAGDLEVVLRDRGVALEETQRIISELVQMGLIRTV